jgi:hypothetical protein
MKNLKFRINEYNCGYVVEYLEVRCFLFFKVKKWKCLVPTFGFPSMPWYHSSYDFAEQSLIEEIKKRTERNSFSNIPVSPKS